MLSCIILTKNSEENILDCIEGVNFCDEIIIIDDFSQDRTSEIVKNYAGKTVKFYERKLNENFSEQRNYGLTKVKEGWALFIDSDERVSQDLKKEIIISLNNQTLAKEYAGFFLKRADVMWGKKLKYGETGKIRLLRLAKKDKGQWYGNVHEIWKIKGKIGQLNNSLLHYPHKTVREFLSHINFYTSIRAKELSKKGAKVGLLQILFIPTGKFFYNFIFKFGFLDGLEGFILAVLMSFHSFLVRGKLFLLNRAK